jgi:isocitrate/isopropylmalate dehydrogenase
MSNEDNDHEFDDHSVGLVRHMAAAIEDFAEFMAFKNRANPRILIASAALALVELSFKHSKPGEQDAAMEATIRGVRVMHSDLVSEQQDEAMAEAEEAKARGSVQ